MDCSILSMDKVVIEEGIDWEDDNDVQEYVFEEGLCCEGIQLRFGGSSDFYGRIIIYNLEIWGTE